MNATDASYIAGFFDGEGTVFFGWYSATKNGRRYGRLIVSIVQAEKEVLDWIVTILGYGTVHTHRGNRLTKKQLWQLKLSGSSARKFLAIVRPHLRVKAAQADAAVALDAMHVTPNIVSLRLAA